MLLLDPAMKKARYFLGCNTAASFQILSNLSRVTLPFSATPFLAAALKYKLLPRFRVRAKVTYEGRIWLRLYACIMMQYNTHHINKCSSLRKMYITCAFHWPPFPGRLCIPNAISLLLLPVFIRTLHLSLLVRLPCCCRCVLMDNKFIQFKNFISSIRVYIFIFIC